MGMDIRTLAGNRKFKLGLLLSLVGLMVGGGAYWVFAPGDDASTRTGGINTRVPIARTEHLDSSKLRIYEEASGVRLEGGLELGGGGGGSMSLLGSYDGEEDSAARAVDEGVSRLLSVSSEGQDVATSGGGGVSSSDMYDPQLEAMKLENARLRDEARLRAEMRAEEERAARAQEREMEMLGQLVAMGSGEGKEKDEGKKVGRRTDLSRVEPVVRADRRVSSLPQAEAPARPGGHGSGAGVAGGDKGGDEAVTHQGFISAFGHVQPLAVNTLAAVVDRTTTVHGNDYVPLRLLEPTVVNGVPIPRNSQLMAKAQVEGKRMQLLVTSIAVGGRIMAVSLSAFDLDGQEGVFIPESENMEALKAFGADMVGTMSALSAERQQQGNIVVTTANNASLKDQLITDVARSAIQGGGKLLRHKLLMLRVTLKSGHRLMLVQSQDEEDEKEKKDGSKRW